MGRGESDGFEATIVASADEMATLREPEAQAASRARPLRIDRYLIVDELGRGGMGIVYAAYDPELDRKVAIKLLLGERRDADARARLLREAQAMARLSHPNVVHVHDVGTTEGGEVFVAMEYIEGQTLGEWMEAAPREQGAILEIFREAGLGLIAAHAVGLIHRDFKPDNVLIDRQGRAKISDFGLAREARGDVGESTPSLGDVLVESRLPLRSEDGSVDLTRTGMLVGTPAYMAPEQHLGLAADARSDQYSFSAALFEALYGRRPFVGATLAELRLKVIGGKLEAPSAGRVPRWIFPILARGLRRDPDERWPSMAALLGALARDPVRARRRWLVGGALGLALVGGLVGAQRWRASEQAAIQAACAAPEEAVTSRFAEAKPRVRASILATGAPTSERAAARSYQALDEFALRWRETHAATCEAAHLRGELTPELLGLRETCLDRHLVGAHAVIDMLTDADAGVVERIDDLLRTLPRPERCTDLAHLARLSDASSPATRAETEAITRDLMRIRASANAGRYADAQAKLTPILAAAEALAKRRLLAQVRGLEGRLAADLGDMAAAEEAYLIALGHALASDADDEAAETANALVYLYGYYLSNRVEAGRWIKVAAGLVDRADNDDLRMQHLNYVGALQSQASEYTEALATYDEAAALAARVGASPHDLATIANNRGVILNYLGRRAEAKEAHQAAIDALLRDLGEVHPDIAMTRNSLGTALLGEGDLDGALTQFSQAIEVQERLIGPDHPMVALTLVNLGSTHVERGELEQGLAEGERALRILEGAGLGPDHLFAGYAHLVVGDARGRLGRPDAREASARALRILEENLGPEHTHVGVALLSLATLDLDEGDVEAAAAKLERAAPLLAASREIGEAELARSEFLSARVQAGRGALAEARASGRRAEARLAPLAPHYVSQRSAIQRWLAGLPPA